MGNAIFYRRFVIEPAMVIMNHLMFYTLFAGGALFSFFESTYIKNFDTGSRQKSTKRVETALPDQAQGPQGRNDWENPLVTSRNKRFAHVPLRAFHSKEDALRYWRLGGGSQSDACKSMLPNIRFLANANDPSLWDFSLFGSPEQCLQFLNFNMKDRSIAQPFTTLTNIEFERRQQLHAKDGGFWGNWTKMVVPGHWQLHGFDIPLYTNTSYPFVFDPPSVRRTGEWVVTDCDQGLGTPAAAALDIHPEEPGENATGLYRHTFSLPENWQGNRADDRVFIVFEGVDSNVSLWINNTFIGYGQDSCLPNEFDISAIVSSGALEFELIAMVMRWCDASYIEDQDKWWLSGVYRDVYLIRKPAVHICDYEVQTTAQQLHQASSSLTINVTIDGIPPAQSYDPSLYLIKAELWPTADGAAMVGPTMLGEVRIANAAQVEDITGIYSSECDLHRPMNPGRVTIQQNIIAPLVWTAETPNLYVLTLTLVKQDSLTERVLDTEACRVGFRSVTCDAARYDHRLCVNGQPIVIAGVNRHEFHPTNGRTVDEEHMRRDIQLLKQFNFNAMRCSHYPPHPRWLELCDEAGVYVVDEANIESHGFQTLGQPVGYLSHQTEWRSALVSRVTRMFERDKNHPSVIIWSLGNESGIGPAHYEMADWLRTRDPRRLVQYESGGARTAATDIICPMYQRPLWCEQQALSDPQGRPVILCEYAHAMGNSGGCLAHYWGDFWDPAKPRVQGGFVWDMIDQGLQREGTPNGYLYGGDFGDKPHSAQFCCNGLFGPDRSPHPSAFEVAALQSPVAFELIGGSSPALKIYNRTSHTPELSNFLVFSIAVGSNLLAQNQQQKPFRTVDRSHEYTLDRITHEFPSILPMESVVIPLHALLPDLIPGPSAGGDADIQKFATRLRTALGVSVDDLAWLKELWIDVCVSYRRSTPWVPVGHEVLRTSFVNNAALAPWVADVMRWIQRLVCSQYIRNPLLQPTAAVAATSKVGFVIDREGGFVKITWSSGASVLINRESGVMCQWQSASGEYFLAEPIDLCLWRAPTDNDRGGTALSYHAQWNAVGLRSMKRKERHTIMTACGYVDNTVVVRIQWTLVPSEAVHVYAEIACTAEYVFSADESVRVTSTVHPPSSLPPLPRIGIKFALSSEFEQVTWCGLGPHEAYDDRLSAVHLGVFSASPDALHVPYVFPQENGRRAGVRWVLFQNTQGTSGLAMLPNCTRIDDASKWGFNCSRFSLNDLTEKAHDFELTAHRDGRLFVHLDSRSMGVGGYDSWSPNVCSQFMIKSGQTYVTSVVFKPVKDCKNNSFQQSQ